MKSIITTYPDFQSLPRGIKMMLLVSENDFFGQVKLPPPRSEAKRQTGGLTIADPDPTNPLHFVHRPFQ
jgi:hypothetical protein